MAPREPVSAAVHRQWSMLQLIPRAPRRIDTGRLEALLSAQGLSVHRRTLQRDLESLAEVFVGLRCDRRDKPYGWHWEASSALFEIPMMTVQQAVTFELVRAHLAHALPKVTRRSLEPHFDRARDVLARSPDAKMARWPRKVRVVPRALPLVPPPIAEPVLDAVATALLEERRLRCRYQSRGRSQAKEYELHPLGLILRATTMVLVCHPGDPSDLRQFLLHRMKSAEILDERARLPRGFDLDEYIAEGIGFRKGKPFRLVARIHDDAALTLSEAALSADQALTPDGSEGWHRLEATAADTLELRGWLLSYAELVEVLEPVALRREIAARLQRAAGMYGA